MATDTLASDHASATDEQIVNKEKSEAIADMIASLANEDEVKHDKPEDANGGHTTPSSKTEGDETNGELGAVEVQNSDDSPAIGDSAEDNPKHDNIEDAPTPEAPLSKMEEDGTKADLAVVVVEKTDDPVSLEAHIGDKLKEEKVIPDSNATDDAAKSQPEEPPSTEQTMEDTPEQLEKEPTETEEEKQPKTVDILEASEVELVKEAEILERNDQKEEKLETEPVAVATEVQEKTQEPEKELEAEVVKEAKFFETSDDLKEKKPEPEPAVIATDVHEKTQEPEKESKAEVVKEADNLETSAQKEEKPEPVAKAVASRVQEKTEEPEKESQEKPKDTEQPSTVTIPEPSTSTDADADAVEEKMRELSAETLKETNDYEAGPTETPKAEPVVTEVEENPKKPENQSLEQKEEKQPNTVAIAEVPSAETSEAIEEKVSEPEVLKETNDYEVEPTKAEKAEPEVTKVDENSSEQEKESFKREEEELPETVIPKTTIAGDTVEVHPPKESDIELVKENDNSESEAVPGEAEKPEVVSVVHQPIVSDIEAVKETSTSELEVVPEKEEKPEPVSTEVEEKPRELVVEAAENVGGTSKEVETKQEIVLETTNNDEEKTDTIKGTISLKEDKTVKGEETSITANTGQVLVNKEGQAAPENLVEPSTEVAEKVVEEDRKKTSSLSDVIEGVSKDEAGVLKIPKQASIDQEAKTDLIEETGVEEKVDVAENDDKEPEAPEADQVSSREAKVEINKDEKQIEAKTATTEDDGPAVENKKRGDVDTNVGEISSAVREPVRETLASKFEEETTKTEVDNLEKEQTEEPVKTEVQVLEEPTKESDATKTSSKDLPKETPAKPAQKQSNNIISKVKHSLVKARKAIIGKSPSSKNHSTEAKDDIQVK